MESLASGLFARRLRRERERAGVGSTDLVRRVADRQGIPFDTTLVERIEDQTRVLRLDEAVVIAEELDVSIVVLISEDPDEEIDGRIAQLQAERTVAEVSWKRADRAADEARRDVLRIDEDLRALSAQHVGSIIGSRGSLDRPGDFSGRSDR